MSVAATMRLVSRDDPSNILFDFDDDTGLANPSQIKTWLTHIDLGEVNRPIDLVKAKGSTFASRAISDPQPRVVSLSFIAQASDNQMTSLTQGMDRLFRYLTSEGAADQLLAWDDGSGVRFFEPIGLERATPNLREESAGWTVAGGLDADLDLEIKCQPYLVSSELDSDDNGTLNSTMTVQGTTTGRPDSWAWDSLTNITSEAIDADKEAYTFTIATTGTRNLQQTTPTGTAVPAATYVDSFYIKAFAAGVVRAQSVIRFCNSSGTPLGSETVGTLTNIGTAWTRLQVAANAPASTSCVLVTLRFSNSAATSTQVWVRDAQVEDGNVASLFHNGYHVIDPDASEPYGMVFPLVVQGSAPTPVIFDIEAGAGAKLVSAVMAARWDQGADGENNVTDYMNYTKWVPAGVTEDGWTVTTENLGSGGGTNVDSDAFSQNGLTISVDDASVGVRLRRWRAVRTTNLDSLRGEWMVYGRFDPRESDVQWDIQLQYGTANIDPVPYTKSSASLTVEAQSDSIDTGLTPYEYIELGRMSIPETGPLSAVRMELWVKRTDDVTPGSGTLRFGGLFLAPYSPRTVVETPDSGSIEWTDAELATSTPKLASEGTGNFDPGDRNDGGGIRMTAPGEGMGVKPATGQSYGTGRTRITFEVTSTKKPGVFGSFFQGGVELTGLQIRVVRISGGAGQAIMVRKKNISKAKNYTLEFDSVNGELYIPQALHKGDNGRRFTIGSITKHFLPFANGDLLDRIVSDPELLEVTKRDSSLNVQAVCDVNGQTPFILEPGRYAIAIVPGEVRSTGHDNDNSPLARTYKVRTRYSPRWTQ